MCGWVPEALAAPFLAFRRKARRIVRSFCMIGFMRPEWELGTSSTDDRLDAPKFLSVSRLRRIGCISLLCLFSLLLASCGGGGGGGNGQDTGDLPEAPYKVHDLLLAPASTGVYVAAHRGAHASFPENSLAAIREAARLGADFAEVDVRLTKDEALVLMHDESLSRTTGVDADVSSLTYAQIQDQTLLGSDSSNPETLRVPTFAEAEALARELGIMLYVDMKTARVDLVADAVKAGAYYEVSLLHATPDQASQLHARDPQLLLMPRLQTLAELNTIIAALPETRIVQLGQDQSDAGFCAAARNAGIKVQQNVLDISGDLAASLGNYSVWKEFVDAGVWLLQTDEPALLVPKARKFRLTGQFP